MKGFNIGLSEIQAASEGSEARPSPVAKLVRLARLAGSKQGSGKKRWGTVVEAARSLRHTIGRTRSEEDSFGSGSSLDQMSPRATSSMSGSNPSLHSSADQNASGAANGGGTGGGGSMTHHHRHHRAVLRKQRSVNEVESVQKEQQSSSSTIHQRRLAGMGRLSALSLNPVKLKMPSFDEGKRGPSLRRLGQQLTLASSLKTKAKRTTSAPAPSTSSTATTATLRASSSSSSKASGAMGQSGSEQIHSAPPTTSTIPIPEQPLTPIPSQHGSSTRSSPDRAVTPTPPSPPQAKSPSPWPLPQALGTSVITSSPPATVSSPETSDGLMQSSSRQPLMSSSTSVSSSKPSNGSAVISRLPGVQPIGKHVPGGWL